MAAIDSGVEVDHPDLRGRIVLARNFVDTREAVAELHGTAVAGIIGARADNSVGIVGVAPDAQLMALRACWQRPADESAAVCSSFTLAKALQFAIDNGAKVINLSLGGPRDRLWSGCSRSPYRAAPWSSPRPIRDLRMAAFLHRFPTYLPSPPMTCTMRPRRSTWRRGGIFRRRSPDVDGASSVVRRTRRPRWRDWSLCWSTSRRTRARNSYAKR